MTADRTLTTADRPAAGTGDPGQVGGTGDPAPVGGTGDPGAPVLVEQRGEVRWLRLNRPRRRNAIDPALLSALDAAVAAAATDPDTAVVVLAGTGTSFCAGADLRHLRSVAATGADPLDFLGRVSACLDRIERVGKPVVAAVHGHVVAGGLELALVCDVVVAREGTLIGDGHVRNGLLPAAGSSVRLPRRVGEPLARWLALTGGLLPAEAFTASGFVHAVAPADRFDELVAATAGRLARAAGPAQTGFKNLLYDVRDLPAGPALAAELDAFGAHWAATDMTAALDRFLGGATGEGRR
ncbi:enoyl-CoA hydratase/isomerase family protein [Polymorphospora sp. NPDC051019]|uniref:enoyl-CoA hydratase/isomerase family protein n=1 Tax=Polymorphospora sp. NPDC051019 TaxID=3155725 RepID=UPI00343117BE